MIRGTLDDSLVKSYYLSVTLLLYLSITTNLYTMSNELTKIKGGRWDSNPRMEVPQTSALTTWLRPPYLNAL